MNIRKSLPLFALMIIVLTLLAYAPSGAADDNRVAVVVDFGNGQVAKRCVSFPEDHITGHEALVRSGLPVEIDLQSGGAAVCRIDGTGCPSNDCFCSCRGGGDNCIYWSYWHLTGGEWHYSMGGSGQYQVSDGEVDGWVWGLGSVTQAQPPPHVSFGDVCADAVPATATISPTPSSTATPIIIMTVTSVPDSPITPTATAVAVTTTALSPTLPAGVTPPLETGIPATTTVATETIAAPLATRPATAAPFTPSAPVDDVTAQPLQPSGGFSTSVPTIASQTPGPATDIVAGPPSTSSQLAEPSGGIIDNPAAIEALPEPEIDKLSATPPAIAAVIGMDVNSAEPVASSSASAAATAAPDEPFNPLSYAGFAGLVSLLGALALLVYRRRVGAGREV